MDADHERLAKLQGQVQGLFILCSTLFETLRPKRRVAAMELLDKRCEVTNAFWLADDLVEADLFREGLETVRVSMLGDGKSDA